MLTVFTRAIIIYLLLLLTMRLMGKRQLGELQPFEFAITMIAAELACIPMAETSIPISYGLIPIFTLFVLHLFITKLASKSIKFRRFLNGKPVILMDKDGINAEILKKVDMNINDLFDALRGGGVFNLNEVAFAILETNGSLSVMQKSTCRPLTAQDMSIVPPEGVLPYTLVCEGHIMQENIDLCGLSTDAVNGFLKGKNVCVKDVLVMTYTDGEVFFQGMRGAASVEQWDGGAE